MGDPLPTAGRSLVRQTLRREIERRLERTADVVTEPLLLCPAVKPDEPFYYRMKAVDDARRLGNSPVGSQGRWGGAERDGGREKGVAGRREMGK